MGQGNTAEGEVDEILEDRFGISTDNYSPDTPLGPEGLDLDSLATVELAEMIEMRLDVSVTDEEIQTVETVADLKSLIRDRQ
jgi:acyl carrier protein